MTKSVDAAGIVWIAPEVVASEQRALIIKRHRGDADALVEKLDEAARAATGEYRRLVNTDDDPNHGSAAKIEGGVGVEEDDGELYVSTEKGYEKYDPKVHGEPYQPILSPQNTSAPDADRSN